MERKIVEKWEKWEKEAQQSLDLDSTVSSGNQWSDPGDGVNRSHYTEIKFPLIIDCKFTEKKGFRLESSFLNLWYRKARELGKIFAMPIRFSNTQEDWVVLKFEDFCQILAEANLPHNKE